MKLQMIFVKKSLYFCLWLCFCNLVTKEMTIMWNQRFLTVLIKQLLTEKLCSCFVHDSNASLGNMIHFGIMKLLLPYLCRTLSHDFNNIT